MRPYVPSSAKLRDHRYTIFLFNMIFESRDAFRVREKRQRRPIDLAVLSATMPFCFCNTRVVGTKILNERK